MGSLAVKARMLILAVGNDDRLFAADPCSMKLALPRPGMSWNWLRQAIGISPPKGSRAAAQGGFTLLELLVVISIIALATAGVSIAMRDSGQTLVEREAARLAALLESARAQSRAGGMPVRWRADAGGFRFEGLPPSALAAMPGQWLDAGTTVRAPTLLVLGPEPLIGPQQVLITHQAYPERTLRIATDGVRPFTVETVQ